MMHLLLIPLLLLLLPSPLWAAIAYVGQTTAEAESGAAPTLNHTFGSGSNKIAIIVRCLRENGGAVAADTAVPTLGGNNTTQIGSGVTNGNNVVRVELYYYLNPPSGSQSIVSSPDATTDRNQTAVLEYTGVAQSSTFGTAVTAQTASTNMDVNSIGSAVNELGILAGCARRGPVADTTASADATSPVSTERIDDPHSGESNTATIIAYEEAGAATSINMRVDLSEAVQWAAMGVSMRPAADPSTRQRSMVLFE